MIRELAFSGEAILMSLAGLTCFSLAIVWVIKKRSGNCFPKLTQKYLDQNWKSSLLSRTQYPDVDAFSYSKSFLLWGLLVATASTLLAINWTIPDFRPKWQVIDLEYSEEITESIRTSIPEPPKLPPPPVVPKIIEIPLEEFIEDQPTFVDEQLTPTENFVVEKQVTKSIPPPPLPPPMKEDKPFIFVEQMPRFPGCEDLVASHKEKEACSRTKLLKFVYDQVVYPQIAQETHIEGTVLVQFVVGKEGLVEDIQILRDPGAGLGNEVLKVVKSMNNMKDKWTPGRQQGQTVKVQYTLPIRFKIQ
ncbi:MAG TPA: energy transducer TonB [Saprospiraceae bacterium]|nr:energy transducer TonB [Saprospiraceae bacterium]HPN71017.1 energy transducer TonB [Saprospiraceae bacterium]